MTGSGSFARGSDLANTAWSALLYAAAVAIAMAYSAAVIATEGSVVLAVLPAGLIAAVLIIRRPVVGMYLTLGGGLLLEQWGIDGLDPITTQTHFFENISSYTQIDLRLSMSDLLVAVTLLGTVISPAHGVRTWRAGPLGVAVGAYLLFFVTGMATGILRGGNWNEGAALAELRGPLYLAVTYLLATNLVRTRQELVRIAVFLVALIGLKAFEAMFNAFVMFDRGVRLEAVTSHEDVVFFDLVLVLALGAAALLGRSRGTYAIFAAVPPVIVAELLNQRRVAFVALIAGVVASSIALAAVRRRTTLRIIGPLLGIFVVYGAAFWNSEGTLAQPIRAVKGIVSPETQSERDRLSNAWRDIENANIAFTLRELPVTGVGLGQEYLFQREPPQLTNFSYWRYMTHNAIFWVWLKAGIAGFAAFWLLVGQAVVACGRLIRKARSPELALGALIPLTLTVAQVAFSAVDLGLTYSRNMIVLGIGLGMLATIADRAAAEA